jgi:serine/threonine-protein kinase RsbW
MEVPDKIRQKKSTGKVQLQAPIDGRYLEYIRAVVGDLAGKVGFSAGEVDQIVLAVDEACSNVIRHAYADGKQWCWQHQDPAIRLEIRTEDGRLVIEIHDHGQRFNIADYRLDDIPQKLAGMKTGGYGIFIIRQFMDELHYSFDNRTGNTLRLVKYLKKP